MNKTLVVISILFVTFLGDYGFAETVESNGQNTDLTFYPYLTLKDIHNHGLVLVLSDGSEWHIKYFSGLWRLLGYGWIEQKDISHWNMGDLIELQAYGEDSVAKFIITIRNLSKNEIALAHYKKPPSVDYLGCLWIVNFDEDRNHVTLSDGTVWEKTTHDIYGTIFESNSSLQSKWAIGDPVTLMRGEIWLNSNCCYLWNHSVNEIPLAARLEL